MIKRTTGLLLILGALIACFSATPARAYDTEQFITELRAKFRTTSNIYLKAESNRLPSTTSTEATDESDTATIILAYAYPRQYLQLLSGRSNKRQYLLVKNDSMAISYPHLDYSEKQSINRAETRKLLARNVPLAAALIGISSGEIPKEAISVDSTYDTVHLTVDQYRDDLPFNRVEAEFKRDNLTPVYFKMEGKRNFHVKVLKYVEEERFPEWIENALSQFDLRWMEDAPV